MNKKYVEIIYSGGWYKAYNESAKIISKILNYKIFYDNNENAYAVGFPSETIEKVISKLDKNKINYVVEKESSVIYHKDYEDSNRFFEYFPKQTEDKECIKEEDIVTIKNLTTKEIESYTIKKIHYDFKVSGTTTGINGVCPIYKTIPIEEINIENNEISSDSELAKKLLGKKINDQIELLDDNLVSTNYLIIDIKRSLNN